MKTGGPQSVFLDEAISRLVSKGLIVVGAAGNEDKDACEYFPASSATVIAVGATNEGNTFYLIKMKLTFLFL